MSEKTKFDVKSPKLIRQIWTVYGAAMVMEAIKEQESTAPGARLALAVAEKIVAEERILLSAEALREAARAGYDVGKSKTVHTTVKGSTVMMEVEMYDLADNAEAD